MPDPNRPRSKKTPKPALQRQIRTRTKPEKDIITEDAGAYDDLNRRLCQHVAQKLPFVVRLYFTQSLTIITTLSTLIQQCAKPTSSGIHRMYIDNLREKLIPQARDVISVASHLCIPTSSFSTPNGPGREAARSAFDAMSASITRFITSLPLSAQKYPGLEDFEECMKACEVKDKKRADVVYRENAGRTVQLASSRRQRFLQTYRDDWSSFR